MACRRYGEPRFDIWFLVEQNSPDCLTVGSMPAYATSAEELRKRRMSPISLKMQAAIMGEMFGMVCR